MRIVKQLADWMRHSGKMDDKRYQAISDAICGVCPDEDGMKSFLLESGQEEGKAAEIEALEAWWDLHGARERARGRMARRMGGGRKEKTTPIKVWHLDACLPKMLFPANAAPDAFPLAKLLLAVAEAAHQRRIGPGWTAFAVAVADLFKADAGKLHDALRAAMENCGRELGPLFVELEAGKTLFPEFFLGEFSGESVTALLKRVNGDETDHTFETSDWILKHPNLNTVHQACLVRNRLHRIYRRRKCLCVSC